MMNKNAPCHQPAKPVQRQGSALGVTKRRYVKTAFLGNQTCRDYCKAAAENGAYYSVADFIHVCCLWKVISRKSSHEKISLLRAALGFLGIRECLKTVKVLDTARQSINVR